jgi:hypothetical protein
LNDDVVTVAVGADIVFVQILLGHVHAEKQNRNQAKVQHRHYTPLGWCDFEIPLFFFGPLTEQ